MAQTVPGGMGIRSLSVSDSSITLHWDEPEDDGGSPLTYYKIYRSISGVNYELIGMTLLLASDKAASFVTGQIIWVDGGFSAMTI